MCARFLPTSLDRVTKGSRRQSVSFCSFVAAEAGQNFPFGKSNFGLPLNGGYDKRAGSPHHFSCKRFSFGRCPLHGETGMHASYAIHGPSELQGAVCPGPGSNIPLQSNVALSCVNVNVRSGQQSVGSKFHSYGGGNFGIDRAARFIDVRYNLLCGLDFAFTVPAA